MVTLKEVAQEAGLSVGTVSQLLHKSDPRYSPDTRNRVAGIAQRLGYRPNHVARSMVRGRTHCVGVVGHMLDSHIGMTRVDAMGSELQGRSYQMFLAGRKVDVEFVEQRRIIEDLIARRVDGLIIFIEPNADTTYYHELGARKIPFVLVGILSDPEELPVVSVDVEDGMYEATRHLLDLGHRNIAAAFGQYIMSYPNLGRPPGFRGAMEELGLSVSLGRIMSEQYATLEATHEFTRSQMTQPFRPTAIVYSNDEMALAGISALRELGLDVPRDVSVVGYDDLPVARYTWPPLTTVRQPNEELSKAVVELLMEHIHNGTSRRGSRVVLKPKLVIRGSTAPVRGR
jgi:LacI family transcriptional regulator